MPILLLEGLLLIAMIAIAMGIICYHHILCFQFYRHASVCYSRSG